MPWLAASAMGRPAIELPEASRATTNASHGPLGASVATGVASIANEATDTRCSARDALVPPPGAELTTATETEVPDARMDGGAVTVSSLAETNIVGTALPLSRTCDVATKLLPPTVTTVAGDPVASVVGETDNSEGAGLLTVNGAVAGPPPGDGLVATTKYVPALARSLALSVVIVSVLLTRVAARAAPL